MVLWRRGRRSSEVDDGSFRHGLITDMDASEGFIVNFGYPDHRAEPIPFHRCFEHTAYFRFAAGDTVHILWRGSDNEAFRWYLARVIAGSSYTFAYVETQRQGEIVREVVKRSWIMASGERRPLMLSWYKQHSSSACWIVSLFALARSRKDFEWWNHEHGRDKILVKVMTGKLIYINCYDHCGWSFWETIGIFRMMARRKKLDENDRNAGKKGHGKRFFFKSCLASRSRTRYHYQSCINTCLPIEVFRQVFFFLDFWEQLNCRIVCRSWHTLLTTVPTCLRTEFNLQEYENDELACVFDKDISQSTRHIILTGNGQQASRSTDPIAVLIDLLKAKSIKLQSIAICNWYVWAPDIFSWSSSLSVHVRSGGKTSVTN
ncbi:uncharacterized protein LOC129595274 [Paramacrobiotus metropolitanus]|uniref:uncharacterized protein LOC129595274 n=1 Tax=Paramacrobiotus metropolitanus TaxID=2943436 RepID=UPI0024463383|nr:uncharacterized protein LOC129595274 [Paramacrobiotus metropolitanus]XP_055348199.1 uncharacterized protein LOC129595274 [Paramacrobiotus metropolitanus]XP_055348200.1 uncharacterized protein LOC129595274 [Paramacrobiotus metropolitanus]